MDSWNRCVNDYLNKSPDIVQKLKDLDKLDEINGLGKGYTLKVCKEIFEDFINIKNELEINLKQFANIIIDYPNTYLYTGRIKNSYKLIEKIIRKRYKKYESNYKNINKDNYKSIITDLAACRIIVHHTFEFIEIHKLLIDTFSLRDNYIDDVILPHVEKNTICEEPTFHHTKSEKDYLKDNGYEKFFKLEYADDKQYRSVHYILSFKSVYIELQVRTIFDDAYSECDHNYVYKLNSKKRALNQFSNLLGKISGTGNEISDIMRHIYISDDCYSIKSENIYDEFAQDKIDKIKKLMKSLNEDIENI